MFTSLAAEIPLYLCDLLLSKLQLIIWPFSSQRIAPPLLAMLLIKVELIKVPFLLFQATPPPELLEVLLMKVQPVKVALAP